MGAYILIILQIPLYLFLSFNNFFPNHHIRHHLISTVTPTTAPSDTQSPSPTLVLTPTSTITPTPTASPTPTLSLTPSPTATPSPTLQLTLTATPSPTISLSPTPTATPSPTPTPSDTPTPTPTITDIPTPTITPTPTASPTPTLLLTPSPTATPSPTKIGNDISFPQCGKTLPNGQGFGIVGVNGGIAPTTNPCLSTELLWANQSLGTQNQTKVQLYVNTGNPGGLNTPAWPHNNTDPVGNTPINPYGTCDGSNSTACSWQYGWNRAVDDVQNKFIPAAQASSVDSMPADYPWWLDVETTNSWEFGSDDSLQKNRVDLEGMVSYFHSIGITIGIYSTNFQWGTIIGNVPSGSNLLGLKNWRPGASNLTDAQSNCSLSALTTSGSVILTQYTIDSFNYDYSCL